MMTRRLRVLLATVLAGLFCTSTLAQAPVLMPFPRDHPFSMGIFDGLRHRGFIEGKNLTIVYRDFAPHADLLSEYAAELVKAQVDLIYGGGGTATHAAQQATKTIPILGFAEDMVGEGLVDSMARPNGNTTGISILATQLNGKRLEILIQLVPGLHRMGALSDTNTTTDLKLHELQEVARAHNIELAIYQVAKGEEIPAAIDAAQASGVTALNVLASPMLFANRQLILDRAAVLRLPAIYEWPELAEAGGFAGYGPRFFKLPEIVARLAVKLFEGTKPADIPVEQPTKFELAINLKTATAIGATVPPSMLALADEVIE
jgi:putative ABC transport system substrate-binding protein